jgi:hypothetical protein
MMLGRADRAAVRDPDDDRHRQAASRPVPHLRDVRDDLIERRIGERVELHLGDRPPTGDGQPHADPRDAGLGERRVEDTGLAEFVL